MATGSLRPWTEGEGTGCRLGPRDRATCGRRWREWFGTVVLVGLDVAGHRGTHGWRGSFGVRVSALAIPARPMRSSPLTSLPGQERNPSFSPDGNQIAFAWDGGNGDNQDIYIKVVGAGVPLRLTTHPAADQKPAWSSDGRHIAFVRSSGEGRGHLRDSRARWSRAQNRGRRSRSTSGRRDRVGLQTEDCWRFLKGPGAGPPQHLPGVHRESGKAEAHVSAGGICW